MTNPVLPLQLMRTCYFYEVMKIKTVKVN